MHPVGAGLVGGGGHHAPPAGAAHHHRPAPQLGTLLQLDRHVEGVHVDVEHGPGPARRGASGRARRVDRSERGISDVG